MDEDGDLRKEIFEELQEDGEFEGVDYAQDVEPWLGQRVGVALLPGTDGGEPEVAEVGDNAVLILSLIHI